ncbi:anthrone oxygenase family protein [Mumia quercus]|uniref:anthrone oxygenase family protein n=1 Tax=Mumia quercus TaxID=2976125 RepID=UPI0021CE04FC|nr:anthrone oxygenase family protein [Mumia quercus]
MSTLAVVLTYVALVGAGVMSGVYVAFSVMVMPSLDRRPPTEAVGFMQETNRFAVRPGFQLAFSGTAVVSLVAALLAVLEGGDGRWWTVAAALAYLASVVLTGTFHVPRNNALDRVDASTVPAAGNAWASYARPWTQANHLRALMCVASVVAYAVALRVG